MLKFISLPKKNLQSLLIYKDFILTQAFGERRAQIADTVLGSFWFLLGPILEMSVYFFLIVVVFERTSFGDVPAFLAIMIGLAHFKVFQTTAQRSISSIVGGRRILLQIKIEPLSFVMIAFLKQMQDAKYYFILIVLTSIYFSYVPSYEIIFYPFILFLIILATWSLSLLLACLYVSFRDLQLLMQTVLRLLLYISPIIYPSTFIPEKWTAYYFLNPFATLFGLLQSSVLSMPWPPTLNIFGCVIFFVLLFFIAHTFYSRTSKNYTKVM